MTRVELLTAPGRDSCQAAKTMVAELIEKARTQVPDILVEEIDVAATPAVPVKYGVTSTPAIAINGKLEFTGVPSEEALLAMRACGRWWSFARRARSAREASAATGRSASTTSRSIPSSVSDGFRARATSPAARPGRPGGGSARQPTARPRGQAFEVVGVYTTGNDLGDNHVFVPIEAFRAVFRPGKKLTKIFVTVDSVGNVERVVQDLKDRTRFPEVDVVTTPEVSTARTTLGSLAVASVYASILWIVAAVFAEVLHGALGLPVAFDGRVLGLVGVGSLVFAALGSLYPVIRGRLGRSDEECPVGMAKFGLRRPSPGSATWSGRRGSPSSPPRSSPGTPSPTPSGRRCLVKGYAGSREVLFQHTEVSDPKVAERLTDMMKSPVLVVPSLTQAPETLVARVWVFTNGVRGGGPFNCRPDVFDHPPGTPGYRPLRAIHLVADMPLVTWPGGGR